MTAFSLDGGRGGGRGVYRDVDGDFPSAALGQLRDSGGQQRDLAVDGKTRVEHDAKCSRTSSSDALHFYYDILQCLWYGKVRRE